MTRFYSNAPTADRMSTTLVSEAAEAMHLSEATVRALLAGKAKLPSHDEMRDERFDDDRRSAWLETSFRVAEDAVRYGKEPGPALERRATEFSAAVEALEGMALKRCARLLSPIGESIAAGLSRVVSTPKHSKSAESAALSKVARHE